MEEKPNVDDLRLMFQYKSEIKTVVAQGKLLRAFRVPCKESRLGAFQAISEPFDDPPVVDDLYLGFSTIFLQAEERRIVVYKVTCPIGR